MPITKAGLEDLGFTEIPAGTKIEAIFNSVVVYNVEGIRFNELTSDSYSEVCYQAVNSRLHLGTV